MNPKWSLIAGGGAFVLSLLIGLLSKVGAMALLRAFILGIAAAIIAQLIYMLIKTYIPDLLEGMDSGGASLEEDFALLTSGGSGAGRSPVAAPLCAPPAAPNPGSMISIHAGDDEPPGGGAVPSFSSQALDGTSETLYNDTDEGSLASAEEIANAAMPDETGGMDVLPDVGTLGVDEGSGLGNASGSGGFFDQFAAPTVPSAPVVNSSPAVPGTQPSSSPDFGGGSFGGGGTTSGGDESIDMPDIGSPSAASPVGLPSIGGAETGIKPDVASSSFEVKGIQGEHSALDYAKAIETVLKRDG
jgi:hypothetical protein